KAANRVLRRSHCTTFSGCVPMVARGDIHLGCVQSPLLSPQRSRSTGKLNSIVSAHFEEKTTDHTYPLVFSASDKAYLAGCLEQWKTSGQIHLVEGWLGPRV